MYDSPDSTFLIQSILRREKVENMYRPAVRVDINLMLPISAKRYVTKNTITFPSIQKGF